MKGSEGKMFPQAIAVTGGIGSGKSRVAHWLSQACAFSLYDADFEVNILLDQGEEGWQRLRWRLSPDYFAADGSLLKAKLRQAIFADEALRRTVEHEIHPLVLARLRSKIFGCEGRSLVEVPLLYEAGWQGYFAEVLVVYAPGDLCCERVMARDGIAEDQAMSAIRVQLPIERKVSLADHVVDNSKAWRDTLGQLEEVRKKWCPAEGE